MKCTIHICNSIVLVLLLLTVTAKCQWPDDIRALNIKSTLKNSFEEALVNSKESLYQLQQVYFNPSQSSRPQKVCLDIVVTVQDIIDPNAKVCGNSKESFENLPDDTWPAFKLCNDDPLYCLDCTYYGPWYLTSKCELKLANDQSGDSAQLSSVLTTSGSTGVFYVFDPSFYNIMKALSTSIDISFPYFHYNVAQNYQADSEVNIRINRSLEQMPCSSDAIDALKMVLVWVS